MESVEMESNGRQIFDILCFPPCLAQWTENYAVPVKPSGKLWAKIRSLKRVIPSQGRIAAWSSSDGARQTLAPVKMTVATGSWCRVTALLPP